MTEQYKKTFANIFRYPVQPLSQEQKGEQIRDLCLATGKEIEKALKGIRRRTLERNILSVFKETPEIDKNKFKEICTAYVPKDVYLTTDEIYRKLREALGSSDTFLNVSNETARMESKNIQIAEEILEILMEMHEEAYFASWLKKIDGSISMMEEKLHKSSIKQFWGLRSEKLAEILHDKDIEETVKIANRRSFGKHDFKYHIRNGIVILGPKEGKIIIPSSEPKEGKPEGTVDKKKETTIKKRTRKPEILRNHEQFCTEIDRRLASYIRGRETTVENLKKLKNSVIKLRDTKGQSELGVKFCESYINTIEFIESMTRGKTVDPDAIESLKSLIPID